MTISQWNVVVLCIGKKYCHHAMFASPLTTIYFSMQRRLLPFWRKKWKRFYSCIKCSTRNMTKDCSVQENYKVRTCCVHKLFWMSKQKAENNLCTQLVLFMYRIGNSMNNLLSHCGLVDARISASEKGLSVTKHIWVINIKKISNLLLQNLYIMILYTCLINNE